MTAEREPWALDIMGAVARMQAGELKPSELLRAVLGRIEQVDRYITAYVVVDRERALVAAEEMDAELARGAPRGPLHGIPVAIKDLYDVAGLPTKRGSRAFEHAPP